MKYKIIASIIILIILGSTYVILSTSNGDIEPLGRLSFVKISNPDMYTGSPHSNLLAQYAEERGSNTALVVHLAGHTNGYPCYQNGNVFIEELGFQDSESNYAENNSYTWLIESSLQMLIFGVPDGRFRYVSDGMVFNNISSAMNYLNERAQAHGQVGKVVMVWHGTVRGGNPNFNLGCGAPLYFNICWYEYGRLAAYYYMVTGILFIYFNSPYTWYELTNAQQLQNAYNSGQLDLQYAPYED
ncbi:MAG: hypothetical protein ACLQG5_08095 [Methanobacterium sp.]|jgi:hypothetical protein